MQPTIKKIYRMAMVPGRGQIASNELAQARIIRLEFMWLTKDLSILNIYLLKSVTLFNVVGVIYCCFRSFRVKVF